MRGVCLTLVFALSVSARCVRKNQLEQAETPAKQPVEVTGTKTLASTVQKQSVQDGNSVSWNTSSAAAPSRGQGSSGTESGQSSTSDGSSTSNTATADSSAGSGGTPTTPKTSGKGSGNCGNLKGVCFNGGMQASMYDLITTATDWITFDITIPGGGASPRTQQDHHPMMPFATNVASAVELVNGPNPPEWLLTFNEPDYSYVGPGFSTATMSPQEAAEKIKPLLAKPGSGTKFVAPGPANPTSNWLPDFFAACNCQDFFSAYNIHQYRATSKEVIDTINTFRSKYSDKPIWLTEVAPSDGGCGLGLEKVSQFMKEIFKFAKDSGFVDRVFWNSGNQVTHEDKNVCESWLIDSSGKPGPLLEVFENIDCT
ncbi:MAG: hypothetical protein Q9197_003379 [Variospora fuerteventurae]